MEQLQTILAMLTTAALADLGPGPRTGVLPQPELAARLDQQFARTSLSTTNRQLARALVLLWHDHLDTAHTIAQGIGNSDGSYVHAMMHRREPDYWNSKYWWRRVGPHPCFPRLAGRVTEFLKGRGEAELLAKLVPGGKWDAAAFVDACETAAALPASDKRPALLREVQRLEFETLLTHFLEAKPR